MTTPDKKIEAIESELKLLKSEVKQGLVDVHDFLLSLKTPPLQVEVDPPYGESDARGNGGGSPGVLTLQSGDGGQSGTKSSQTEPLAPVMEKGEPMPAKQSVLEPPQQQAEKVSVPIFEQQKKEEPKTEARKETPPAAKAETPRDEFSKETAKSNVINPPQVNLLANLVRWVSVAKKEIGGEQLPVFLDVYASSGNLYPEMREVILQLAEVATSPADERRNNRLITEKLSAFLEIHRISGHISPELKKDILCFVGLIDEQTAGSNTADVWSRLILELHGILSDSTTPLRPFKVSSNGKGNKVHIEKKGNGNGQTNEAEVHEAKLRLKLVMPVADGIEREFDVL